MTTLLDRRPIFLLHVKVAFHLRISVSKNWVFLLICCRELLLTISKCNNYVLPFCDLKRNRSTKWQGLNIEYKIITEGSPLLQNDTKLRQLRSTLIWGVFFFFKNQILGMLNIFRKLEMFSDLASSKKGLPSVIIYRQVNSKILSTQQLRNCYFSERSQWDIIQKNSHDLWGRQRTLRSCSLQRWSSRWSHQLPWNHSDPISLLFIKDMCS